ncbi:hypothetical protein QJQ45_016393 [Haematococcus lacustris]|nr:hypothetical protein QJQ45_016393 [Haematococcus lacustris]
MSVSANASCAKDQHQLLGTPMALHGHFSHREHEWYEWRRSSRVHCLPCPDRRRSAVRGAGYKCSLGLRPTPPWLTSMSGLKFKVKFGGGVKAPTPSGTPNGQPPELVSASLPVASSQPNTPAPALQLGTEKKRKRADESTPCDVPDGSEQKRAAVAPSPASAPPTGLKLKLKLASAVAANPAPPALQLAPAIATGQTPGSSQPRPRIVIKQSSTKPAAQIPGPSVACNLQGSAAGAYADHSRASGVAVLLGSPGADQKAQVKALEKAQAREDRERAAAQQREAERAAVQSQKIAAAQEAKAQAAVGSVMQSVFGTKVKIRVKQPASSQQPSTYGMPPPLTYTSSLLPSEAGGGGGRGGRGRSGKGGSSRATRSQGQPQPSAFVLSSGISFGLDEEQSSGNMGDGKDSDDSLYQPSPGSDDGYDPFNSSTKSKGGGSGAARGGKAGGRGGATSGLRGHRRPKSGPDPSHFSLPSFTGLGPAGGQWGSADLAQGGPFLLPDLPGTFPGLGLGLEGMDLDAAAGGLGVGGAVAAPLPMKRVMEKVMDSLASKDKYKLFKAPVTDAMAPNYSTIITNPMCFDVIRAKIKDNYYANYDMLQADIQLVFDNAMHYNPVDNWVHSMAKCLQEVAGKYMSLARLGIANFRGVADDILKRHKPEIDRQIKASVKAAKARAAEAEPTALRPSAGGSLRSGASTTSRALPAPPPTSSSTAYGRGHRQHAGVSYAAVEGAVGPNGALLDPQPALGGMAPRAGRGGRGSRGGRGGAHSAGRLARMALDPDAVRLGAAFLRKSEVEDFRDSYHPSAPTTTLHAAVWRGMAGGCNAAGMDLPLGRPAIKPCWPGAYPFPSLQAASHAAQLSALTNTQAPGFDGAGLAQDSYVRSLARLVRRCSPALQQVLIRRRLAPCMTVEGAPGPAGPPVLPGQQGLAGQGMPSGAGQGPAGGLPGQQGLPAQHGLVGQGVMSSAPNGVVTGALVQGPVGGLPGQQALPGLAGQGMSAGAGQGPVGGLPMVPLQGQQVQQPTGQVGPLPQQPGMQQQLPSLQQGQPHGQQQQTMAMLQGHTHPVAPLQPPSQQAPPPQQQPTHHGLQQQQQQQQPWQATQLPLSSAPPAAQQGVPPSTVQPSSGQPGVAYPTASAAGTHPGFTGSQGLPPAPQGPTGADSLVGAQQQPPAGGATNPLSAGHGPGTGSNPGTGLGPGSVPGTSPGAGFSSTLVPAPCVPHALPQLQSQSGGTGFVASYPAPGGGHQGQGLPASGAAAELHGAQQGPGQASWPAQAGQVYPANPVQQHPHPHQQQLGQAQLVQQQLQQQHPGQMQVVQQQQQQQQYPQQHVPHQVQQVEHQHVQQQFMVQQQQQQHGQHGQQPSLPLQGIPSQQHPLTQPSQLPVQSQIPSQHGFEPTAEQGHQHHQGQQQPYAGHQQAQSDAASTQLQHAAQQQHVASHQLQHHQHQHQQQHQQQQQQQQLGQQQHPHQWQPQPLAAGSPQPLQQPMQAQQTRQHPPAVGYAPHQQLPQPLPQQAQPHTQQPPDPSHLPPHTSTFGAAEGGGPMSATQGPDSQPYHGLSAAPFGVDVSSMVGSSGLSAAPLGLAPNPNQQHQQYLTQPPPPAAPAAAAPQMQQQYHQAQPQWQGDPPHYQQQQLMQQQQQLHEEQQQQQHHHHLQQLMQQQQQLHEEQQQQQHHHQHQLMQHQLIQQQQHSLEEQQQHNHHHHPQQQHHQDQLEQHLHAQQHHMSQPQYPTTAQAHAHALHAAPLPTALSVLSAQPLQDTSMAELPPATP